LVIPGEMVQHERGPRDAYRQRILEKIGGLGTYQAFIDAVNEIGPHYKDRIYREFLGIEPPPGAEKMSQLKS